MSVGIMYQILECLNEGKMLFSSDREAEEFCDDNGLPYSCIEYDGDDIYIANAPEQIKKARLNDIMQSKSTNNRAYSAKSHNSYKYKGLGRYTDDQIKLLQIHNAIIKDKSGYYKADWSKVHR